MHTARQQQQQQQQWTNWMPYSRLSDLIIPCFPILFYFWSNYIVGLDFFSLHVEWLKTCGRKVIALSNKLINLALEGNKWNFNFFIWLCISRPAKYFHDYYIRNSFFRRNCRIICRTIYIPNVSHRKMCR